MVATEITFTEAIGPYLPVIGIIVGGIIVGVFAVYNRAKGNVEAKAPTVAELWAREERLSRRVRWLETAAWRIQFAFGGYSNRVRSGGSPDPTPTEQAALDIDLSDNNSKEKP
ncbi:hypothetical protein [Microbacterium oxydans]|uniref:hypothetical protein n=1 Tax=Microbacterium oxydans TaxID=82380 RepID=UPI0037CA6FCD